MKTLVMGMMGALMLITPASANIFSDGLDAITGHTSDLYERLTHDNENVKGVRIREAKFRQDDPGQDAFHWVKGDVELIVNDDGYWIQLEENFKAGHAPDLFIYLADRRIEDETDFRRAMTFELGELKSGKGAQYYHIQDYNFNGDHLEVIIWCKQFEEFMGAATLVEDN